MITKLNKTLSKLLKNTINYYSVIATVITYFVILPTSFSSTFPIIILSLVIFSLYLAFTKLANKKTHKLAYVFVYSTTISLHIVYFVSPYNNVFITQIVHDIESKALITIGGLTIAGLIFISLLKTTFWIFTKITARVSKVLSTILIFVYLSFFALLLLYTFEEVNKLQILIDPQLKAQAFVGHLLVGSIPILVARHLIFGVEDKRHKSKVN